MEEENCQTGMLYNEICMLTFAKLAVQSEIVRIQDEDDNNCDIRFLEELRQSIGTPVLSFCCRFPSCFSTSLILYCFTVQKLLGIVASLAAY